MITRRDNLESALGEIEAKQLVGATTIVVNLEWWSGLSAAQQEDYKLRADRARIGLVADAEISSHYVEIRGMDEGPPMTSELPV